MDYIHLKGTGGDLWISDISTTRNSSVPTETVVTVCQDDIYDNISDSTRYFHFNMADGECDGYGGDDSYECFERAVTIVLNELDADHDVLVHCHAGQSRSAAVCITAVATVDDYSYSEAYRRVEDARSIIDPNPELVEKIWQFLSSD